MRVYREGEMILRFLLIFNLLVVPASSADAAEKLIYGVFWEGCEHGCEGFIEAIKASAFPARVIVRDAEQNKLKLPAFIEEARRMKADLVLTYGTSVTLGIAGRLENAGDEHFITEIPLVFMYVSDPFGSGIAKSFEKSGRNNVTGTYNRVPEAVNIRTIKSIKPDFTHLGMIYNGNENNSVIKVKEMSELSREMGFSLTALKIDPDSVGVPDPQLIPERVRELARAGVDFIYLGSSSFLRLNADVFTSAAVENGLPILSPYEEVVRESEALVSIAARAKDVGRVAADQVLRILRDGATPGELPIARVTEFAYVVNMAVARKLNTFPPIDILQVAETLD
jgi:putative ABC transport system substrate-binding protein